MLCNNWWSDRRRLVTKKFRVLVNVGIGPYHSMSKLKILPVKPLIQCEAGRAKTMQRQSLYSPRTPRWPPSDKGELIQTFYKYDFFALFRDNFAFGKKKFNLAMVSEINCHIRSNYGI